MPESWWGNAIFSLVPTIVLGLIFWMVMRMIIRGDRTALVVGVEAAARRHAGAAVPHELLEQLGRLTVLQLAGERLDVARRLLEQVTRGAGGAGLAGPPGVG